jgi:dCMP deaminase
MRPDKAKLFMDNAMSIAAHSKDKSTKVGALILDEKRGFGPGGYNGIPRGLNDDLPHRHDRSGPKYRYFEHAERNAIFAAARAGYPTDGCTMFVTMFPCCDCARAIIQAGIVQLYTREPDPAATKWAESFAASREMLIEAGVKITYLDQGGNLWFDPPYSIKVRLPQRSWSDPAFTGVEFPAGNELI